MKIVLLEPIGINKDKLDLIASNFETNGHDFEYFTTKVNDDESLIKRGEKAEVLIIGNTSLSGNVINACSKLKMISVAFTGVDHIDMKTCTKKNILVSNAAGYSNHAVAELTMGMTIQLIRKLQWAEGQTRELKDREGFLGSELNNKTFGIIGTGQIGLGVAKIANAFGCKILAYNRSKKAIPYIKYVSLDELLSKSDIVSIHIPLNKETENLIDDEKLSLMKKTALLINTARGPIINSSNLADALKNGKLAGAAVDVYEKEPPLDADHPLFNAPNIIMLPHIGYATKEAIDLRGDIVIDNVIKWMDGKPQNVMNFR